MEGVELRESHLAKIDWVAFSASLAAKPLTFESVKLLNDIFCLIADYKIENDENILVDAERIRLWLPLAKVISDSSTSLILGVKRRGDCLFCVKTCQKKRNLKNEYKIMTKLNNLRSHIQQFPFTYGLVKAMIPIHDGTSALSWMVDPIFESTDHLFLEYVNSKYRLDDFLRKSENTSLTYLSIFLQVILAQRFAYNNFLFVHGNLIVQNVLLEHVKDASWIKISDSNEWIKTDYVTKICGFGHCSIQDGDKLLFADDFDQFEEHYITLNDEIYKNNNCKDGNRGRDRDRGDGDGDGDELKSDLELRKEGRRYPIYDIYMLTATFIYNLSSKRNQSADIKITINILTELLLSLDIPIYLINRIRMVAINDDIVYSTLSSKLIEIKYETTLSELLSICNKKGVDISLIYQKDIQEDKIHSKNDKPVDNNPINIPFKINPLDGYICAIAEGVTFKDVPLSVPSSDMIIYTKAHDAAIKSLMDNIEKTNISVNDSLRIINMATDQQLLYSSPQELRDHIEKYCLLFEDLYLIRVYLDDLRIKLQHRECLIQDGTNTNLFNYIKEKTAKLMRILGENDIIYKKAHKLLDPETMKKIDLIWRLLHCQTVRTR